ncbi:ABC transporter permease [Pseudalkalibacillus hwajinpoensis]|uniref:FtsX-like permease family protein n=1 Tax=Guptibacillus hwajinpoensis TaxID=208199 RepID=A0A4U1MLS3_9BACL|nr:FtsX-like permease family protein [Pseudalkalibacillus hwajinpoensis]TKD72183.1 FtsX-like permease family protein [Pseudalkalibacillus hwajinpoensis]
MSINQMILRNMRKNLKNYYLYVFALVFSVGLYFSFVTLQYDPGVDNVETSAKMAAAIRTAAIMLVVIVTVFLVYANSIFIKRRGKEIGLFQLIGMTKGRIFRVLTIENLIIYISSMLIGIFVGFSFSKLIQMVLFKTTGITEVASLNFSAAALLQTVIVFFVIFGVIMLTNWIFIKGQSILSLFRATSKTEGQIRNISILEIIMGLLGLVLIIAGYYVSSKLFDGDFSVMNELLFAMAFILGAVILGTYLFYKGSIRFVANLLRKRKKGYLNINDVMSLSSIMFRMKSNSLLLTIITTVSALAIGLSSLSYISYYSAEKTSKQNIPDHFSLADEQNAKQFEQELKESGFDFYQKEFKVLQANVVTKEILVKQQSGAAFDPSEMVLPIISDQALNEMNAAPDEAIFTGYSKVLASVISFDKEGLIQIEGKEKVIDQDYLGLENDYILPYSYSDGGLPTVVVDQTTFASLQEDIDEEVQDEPLTYFGFNLEDPSNLSEATDLFQSLSYNDDEGRSSQYEAFLQQKENMGLVMFIVGFLGLTFLITSGCILYFKQMNESEEERPNYTVLRKLGFTEADLSRGVRGKQLVNFGIPLIVGLLHGYFAVRSGWFFFGTEFYTPMLIVMGIYTILYSIFGGLSIVYYKKVIREAL